MLSYQSLSYHDALALRATLGVRGAPEFEAWLGGMGLLDAQGGIRALTDGAETLVRRLGDASLAA
jgi:ethanolamine ammonia-lyase large subunit